MTGNNKKRNENTIKLIEKNLNDFYTTIAETSGISLYKGQNINWIKNKPGLWPGFIYNTSSELLLSSKEISKIAKEINNNNAPPFWIIQAEKNVSYFESVFAKYNMRPVIQWTGMAADLTSFKRNEKIAGEVKFITVNSSVQLRLWIDIVNSVLFNSKKLDYELFVSLLKTTVFKLFLGYYKNQPVTTSMRFLSAETAGFYFITTLPEFRNKGFGYESTLVAINESINKGYDIGVLHATASAESIYKKLGFKDYCKLNIYWMLGKY